MDVTTNEAGFRPASRIATLGVSEILQIGARASAMKRAGAPVIILGAGEPDFIKNSAADAMHVSLGRPVSRDSA